MQQMKEQLDTGYQRLRREHLEGVEEQRKASLSQEELEEEERQNEETRLFVEHNRAKITDLNEVKKYTIDATLQPHERSFLIQPEKPSNRKRIPQIFGQSKQSNQLSTSNLNADIRPTFEGSDMLNTFNEDVVSGGEHHITSKITLEPHAEQSLGLGAFGKRSQSMAAPNLLPPVQTDQRRNLQFFE